jgi:4-hydroxy-3-methylbut-2-enyl diphosphate reductase
MSKKILLASPRGWCAGVDRAVEIVEQALETHGRPVYVRKQIVHNLHVVQELEARGAIFVESEEEVPEGAVCVFSAHGVSPAVHENARRRNLHVEARRFAKADRTIFLIGHEGHEEVEGTSGVAPERTIVIESPEDVDKVEVNDPENVSYVSQTTLAVDDAMKVVEALRRRFPTITGPTRNDICYASQNRQEAVKAIAAEADVVFVVGSENSSNSNRLVEVAREEGAEAHLVQDETSLRGSWLAEASVAGVSSGASTPEVLVERVLEFLHENGFSDTEEVAVAEENVRFPLPVIALGTGA